MTTAFLFPGQGSQFVGMGRDLYESSPAARAVFERADATLGLALMRLCFEGPDEELLATENAQPALLTVSVALLAAMAETTELGSFVAGRACFVAGHSLGEYSALVAAGALDFVTALRLVRRRGELMAQAREGTMAAIIGLDETPIEIACREASQDGSVVVVANYNSPGQLVISGAADAVERASALAKQAGARRVVPLRVSAAFHSPLMADAAAGLRPALAEAVIVAPGVSVVANVTAELITNVDEVRRELDIQVTAPVRWTASVRRMAEAGVDTFIEVGPGAVLAGLVRRIVPEARVVNVQDTATMQGYRSSQF